jgi:peptidoglycan hydrolase CwlO-like protein
MKIKNKYKYKNKVYPVFLITGVLFFIFNFSNTSLAASYNCTGLVGEIKILCENIKDINCNDLANKDDREKCEKTDKEVADAIKNSKLIQKTQGVLVDQLTYINNEQVKTQQNLNRIKSDLDELMEKIKSLERNIAEKEKDINYQKKILSGLMQSYYEYDRQGILDIVLLNKDFSQSLNQSDYIEQSGIKVKNVLEIIRASQDELFKDKKELDQGLQKNETLKSDLEDKKDDLQATEYQKQSLLTKTQGEEEKYKQLLIKIEGQKKQLFDFSGFGSYTITDDDRPKDKYKLSTSWYYSQRDSRWKNKEIGDGTISRYTMENWGCAVASVAMMKTFYGNKTTPKDILKKPTTNFDGLDIEWSATLGNHKDTGYGYRNYKSKLNSILNNNDIAIIHIHIYGGGHFLVVGGKDKNDYIVHDPYFGSNLYLGTSLALMKKISNGSAYVDRIIYK